MRPKRPLRQIVLLGLLAGLFCTGCAYMRNRGRDAKDILDPGITLSRAPQFAFHFDFFNILPVGYSRVEGTYLGLGNRQSGVLDFYDDTWGAVLWGSEELQIGQFDPNDPRQARARDIAALKAEGKPLPTRTQRYNEGVARMLSEGNTPPHPSFYS